MSILPLRRAFVAFPLLFAAGCSSYELPTVADSERRIALLRPEIERADRTIDAIGDKLVMNRDIVLRVRREAFNGILAVLAGNSSDDARIVFNGNRPWIEEQKNILGIRYRNYLNIDGGRVDLNLASFRFTSFAANRLRAAIHMEGKGAISVSGSHTGIPASSTPDILLDLNDELSFLVVPGDSGAILLVPEEKTVPLRIRFLVKLLEWRIPWNEVVLLNTKDLMKPLVIPSTISSRVSIPTIAQDPKERYTLVPRRLFLLDPVVTAADEVLEWRGNLVFGK